MKNIGVLTGGGDCPGLNAAIRAVVRHSIDTYSFNVIGFKRGWAGLLEGLVEPLTKYAVSGILPKGGTILGTSRTNPDKVEDGYLKIRENFRKFGLDAIISIGGNDTLGVAANLQIKYDVPCVCVPKTIDNDVACTDFTIGFDTAVSIATAAIDNLHSTAESHDRVMVVEVMGRHAGWIAAFSGIAGGADIILVPEKPFNMDEVCEILKKRHKRRGRSFSIIVAAEGATSDDGAISAKSAKTDPFGNIILGGLGVTLSHEIEKKTGFETRYVILGHTQRGGTPTPVDRILATRFGVRAVDLVARGETGKMVGTSGGSIVQVPVLDIVETDKKGFYKGKTKTLDMEFYETAKVFFG
ncbi:MAG: 6-phosphofructokinase [Deltaproteobacteria bacterium]|nr:6-phosphofructokinase [Deltaproteobacteria bacterium]